MSCQSISCSMKTVGKSLLEQGKSLGLTEEAAKKPRKSQESERNRKKGPWNNHCCREAISQGRRIGEENSKLKNRGKIGTTDISGWYFFTWCHYLRNFHCSCIDITFLRIVNYYLNFNQNSRWIDKFSEIWTIHDSLLYSSCQSE